MQRMAALRVPVDAFFDGVKVNADDKEVRENRLNLLASLRATLHQVADFSRIEDPGVMARRSAGHPVGDMF